MEFGLSLSPWKLSNVLVVSAWMGDQASEGNTFTRFGIHRQISRIFFVPFIKAESRSSVGSVGDLRTGGRWFDPRLGQYSLRGLMIVIGTGSIPLSPLSVVVKQPVA